MDRRNFLKVMMTGVSSFVGLQQSAKGNLMALDSAEVPDSQETVSDPKDAVTSGKDKMAIGYATTNIPSAFIPDIESEMSRRYLMMIQKWVPICMRYFSDWPVRPKCGHFFGGVSWYGTETAFPVEVLALISTSPEYDERVTGSSREGIRQAAIKGIRYLCFTHDTGPEDCVRPEKGLARSQNCGTKWGERGKGFFKESQCGKTVSSITTATLALRPWIDHETWMMVAGICEDYLNRFGSMPPKSGVYANTQLEENAWTSHGLVASCLFLSNHERFEEWEKNAKQWMFSTAVAPQDRFDLSDYADGLSVRKLAGNTFTLLPDYMAENHGIVHPSYTSYTLFSLGVLGNLYRIHRKVEPKHAYWNCQIIYENMSQMIDLSGCPHCMQGMDGPYLNLIAKCGRHSGAYLYLKNPDAGYFEEIILSMAEKIQDGFNGHVMNPDLAEKCYEPQDPIIMKESQMGIMAKPYLAHRLMDKEAPEPTPEDEIKRKFLGVRVYPHSGFAFHRHPRGQTSLSWRNEIMALPLTREGIFTIAPSRGTLLSKVSVKGHKPSPKLVSSRVTDQSEGFAAILVNDQASGSIRQKTFFASLPNGSVVCLETLVALKDCVVQSVEQGYLQIINDNFPMIKGNNDGYRMLYYPDGRKRFNSYVSASPDDDVEFRLGDPGWLNVDDRVGIVFSGTGKTVYVNRHFFKPYRATADDLYLSLQDEEREYREGETVAELAFLLCPEQSHEQTPDQSLTKVVSAERDAVCLITPNYMCSFRSPVLTSDGFNDALLLEKISSFKLPRRDMVPVFSGQMRLGRDYSEVSLKLFPGQANFSKLLFLMETDGTVEVNVIPEDSAFLTNVGNESADIRIFREGREKSLRVEPGKIVRIGVESFAK